MTGYVVAARRLPALVREVEKAVSNMKDGVILRPIDVARVIHLGGRPASEEEGLVALNALSKLGVVVRSGSGYQFSAEKYAETAEFRRGVWAAIRAAPSTDQLVEAQFCVSLPPKLRAAAEEVIRERTADLRATLLDLIASARISLILASPFWDFDTTSEIAVLLEKRLAAGVAVDIIGRFDDKASVGARNALLALSQSGRCRVLAWYDPVGHDVETFHFKAVSADGGQRAFVGSANMTVSSFRSRMEFGVVLRGEPARHVDGVLRVVTALAKAVEPIGSRPNYLGPGSA
jgi:phosphatidylserine/phosphatidylglycerophosphate/cardiolipin synthase-like enzyme